MMVDYDLAILHTVGSASKSTLQVMPTTAGDFQPSGWRENSPQPWAADLFHLKKPSGRRFVSVGRAACGVWRAAGNAEARWFGSSNAEASQ